jgi:hypothetical protein
MRRLVGLLLYALVVVSIVACTDDDSPLGGSEADETTTTSGASTSAPPPTTSPLAAALCDAGDAEQIGVVGSSRLDELSGLETADVSPGVLWAIEDSGNDPALFALDPNGAELAELPVQAENVDWEALDATPDGTLHIGDVGDNLRTRSAVTIYSVDAPSDPRAADGPLAAIATTVRYPDEPHDVEALFTDPLTGDLFLVTKALDQRTLTFERDSIVYRIPSPAGGEVSAEEVGRLQVGTLEMVTGADMATDGSTIALRTYASILFWERDPAESVADALKREPCTLDGPPDRIGESIAIDTDGSVLTSSEGAAAPIWRISPARDG